MKKILSDKYYFEYIESLILKEADIQTHYKMLGINYNKKDNLAFREIFNSFSKKWQRYSEKNITALLICLWNIYKHELAGSRLTRAKYTILGTPLQHNSL
jgi:hypothetical protein